jgi:periplasmic copper chaperone A
MAVSLLLAPVPTAHAHDIAAGSLVIQHPWTRATPPTVTAAAGYLKVRNSGGADRLLGASLEGAVRGELHESTVGNDGVMRMRPLPEGVPVPAGGELSLAPDGIHLMFVQLKEPLVEDRTVPGTLTFEHAGTVAVEFVVEAAGARHKGH